ncbi:hypothetical protein [Chryseobacterium viscerum]|uniref:Uncharacterized protein n=1 Tax=Chryseobacterium viscerum TaxID=1037377 RepID=A0A316W9V9_9FLAO|nr:hypothetical protein [Chryseobacterium viscerum]PWN58131.1 hypothetical protein C1634_024465 [Chryseobacterium viscerum]
MKVFLCYQHGSVVIKWNLPFFPRIGEYISTTELLSEKEFKQLGTKKDYLKIINISWFLYKDSKQSAVEILLE